MSKNPEDLDRVNRITQKLNKFSERLSKRKEKLKIRFSNK